MILEKRLLIAIVWMSFPSLPPNYFIKEAIFSLASAVEKPLHFDLSTKNQNTPSCVKVKIEVDLLREYPQCIQIGDRKSLTN